MEDLALADRRREVMEKLAAAPRRDLGERKRAIADAAIGSAPVEAAPTRGARRLIAVRHRDGSRCWLCGEFLDFCKAADGSFPGVTLDHVVPRSHGGPDCVENLRLAHEACNRARGNGPARPHELWSRDRAETARRGKR